ncbi:MAG: SRPBCC family protein [Planctomycetota bacterium]
MTTMSAEPPTTSTTRTAPTDPGQSVTVSREGRGWVLRAEQTLPRSLDELWPFFADAHNLGELTPPLLRFNVLTPRPIEMRAGALIDYKIRIRGVPVKWKTEILAWEPPARAAERDARTARFIDNQIKGPYVRWHHEHTFVERRTGSGVETLCGDIVHYEVPGLFLAPVVNSLLVERDVRNIFRFRAEVMARKFGERG